jgi:hypothetical protein
MHKEIEKTTKKKSKIMDKSIVQKKANDTGLPDNLKMGMERLSGLDLSDTRVHYNSSKPAQFQAHAYAQGTDIHLGSGQEKHLPHEAWHVVQQKQGRVKPTMQMKGKVNVNDDAGLEKEADVMGAKALAMGGNSGAVPYRGIGGQYVRPDPLVVSGSGEQSARIKNDSNTAQLYTKGTQYIKSENEQYKLGKKGDNDGSGFLHIKKSNGNDRSLIEKYCDITELQGDWIKATSKAAFAADCVKACEMIINKRDTAEDNQSLLVTRERGKVMGHTDTNNKLNAENETQHTETGHHPNIGEGYWIQANDKKDFGGLECNYHGAAVVAQDGEDRITLEVWGNDFEEGKVTGVFKIYSTKPKHIRTVSGEQSFHDYYNSGYYFNDKGKTIVVKARP